MVNLNGTLTEQDVASISQNRAFLYGDGVFETMKIRNGKVLFFEDHYFRLMSAMRILRMEIPMEFTMEYLEGEVLATAHACNCASSARGRITIYRNPGGHYMPLSNDVSFVITTSELPVRDYVISDTRYEVDLYKDFYVATQLLSTIKSTNRIINVIGNIYALENQLDNCLLLNDRKNVIEALNGNIFMVNGNRITTPPISEGCLAGVMRKQLLAIIKSRAELEIFEEVISPFDLQKADELFISNVILGIQPITQYRKKEYGMEISRTLMEELNVRIHS
ncbi:MAG TPA: aminotransferase class IV [Flavobacterium sp.]|jgi:branched-chain amino acid aminotransferase